MERRLWTAKELEQLTRAAQDAFFEASVVTSLDDVPEDSPEKVRARVEQRLVRGDAPPR